MSVNERSLELCTHNNVQSKLSALRAATQHILKSKVARDAYPFSYINGGVPRGAITEISGRNGSGKSEAVIKLLAENPSARVAWIEEDFTAYPCALPQLGVKLERVLFVEAGHDLLWSGHQVLRSGLFEIVVLVPGPARSRRAQNFSEVDLRRLQLTAEKSQASVILLTDRPTQHANWAISLQLQVSRRRSDVPLSLQIIKGSRAQQTRGESCTENQIAIR